MEKYCKRCNTTKPVSEFHRRAASKDGLSHYCRQCNKQASKEQREKKPDYHKEWIEKNPDKVKEYAKRKKSQQYGITMERYNDLLDQQNNCCAICGGVNENGRSLYVDHNHNCCPGKETCGNCIRQLLCLHCNSGLGFFRDDSELLKKAVNYLERHSRPKNLEIISQGD